ncbi:MAG: DoxX family membrane protein [Rudaea sp.]
MNALSLGIAFLTRFLLIALFLPFSALDKLLNPRQAIAQAEQVVRPRALAAAFIVIGGIVEVIMSLAILTGFMDRLAAFVLGGYCLVTALLWKRFWGAGDFRLQGSSRGRDIFWDFLKNVALAGAFFMLAFGATASGPREFLAHPLASTHPYRAIEQGH